MDAQKATSCIGLKATRSFSNAGLAGSFDEPFAGVLVCFWDVVFSTEGVTFLFHTWAGEGI